MSALDAALAWNARTGAPVFPCWEDKRPATPQGFKDAVADPAAIRELWRRFPGPLVGMPTGAVSGTAVLDLDFPRHPEAWEWFKANQYRLPQTLAIETRSGGWHLYYQHQPGLRCSAGAIAPGVDVRANGGYVIAWGVEGHRTVSEAAMPPWPEWVAPPPKATPKPRSWLSKGERRPADHTEAALAGICRTVATAAEGNRNSCLFWGAARCAEMITCGELSRRHAEALLMECAARIGLDANEISRTIASAFTRRTA